MKDLISMRRFLTTLACFGLIALFLWGGFSQNASAAAPKGWHTSFQKASDAAKASGKPIFIKFTGSDWCRPCKDMQQKVLDTKKFKQWAAKNVTLLYIDFPRDKSKIRKKQLKHNLELQKRFSVKVFPTVLVLKTNAKEAGRDARYRGADVSSYIKAITPIISKAKKKAK